MALAYDGAIAQLIDAFAGLPGIGPKGAQRIAFYLLGVDEAKAQHLADAIIEVKEKVRFCDICGNVCESSPCPICVDPRRDHTVICVVQEPKDVMSIERTREYRGLYHVLGGAIDPMANIGPSDLSIVQLLHRLAPHNHSAEESHESSGMIRSDDSTNLSNSTSLSGSINLSGSAVPSDSAQLSDSLGLSESPEAVNHGVAQEVADPILPQAASAPSASISASSVSRNSQGQLSIYAHVANTVDSSTSSNLADNTVTQPFVETEDVNEVILALNPNIEGDATTRYLAQLLMPLGITVTRLASGLPVGSDLEYADEITLGRAISGRREA